MDKCLLIPCIALSKLENGPESRNYSRSNNNIKVRSVLFTSAWQLTAHQATAVSWLAGEKQDIADGLKIGLRWCSS